MRLKNRLIFINQANYQVAREIRMLSAWIQAGNRLQFTKHALRGGEEENGGVAFAAGLPLLLQKATLLAENVSCSLPGGLLDSLLEKL